jgi:hypothetical protein
MTMKTPVTLWAVLFASSLTAQSAPGQSSGANKRHSKNPGVTEQGCLGSQKGDYVLMQTDPGNTYELEASPKIKLDSHLGEQVEVTGWERPSLSTSSDTFVPNRGVSSVTIIVESIRMIAKECTLTANLVAAPVSEAQLHISSTPTDADIEISACSEEKVITSLGKRRSLGENPKNTLPDLVTTRVACDVAHKWPTQ